jgi:hypothetical protein
MICEATFASLNNADAQRQQTIGTARNFSLVRSIVVERAAERNSKERLAVNRNATLFWTASQQSYSASAAVLSDVIAFGHAHLFFQAAGSAFE